MLWYCAFTWYPDTTREQVAQRVVEQHDAGRHSAEQIRGWYNLAGGGAGFLIVQADTAEAITQMLQPYMDLMSWDVRAISELQYEQEVEHMRQVAAS